MGWATHARDPLILKTGRGFPGGNELWTGPSPPPQVSGGHRLDKVQQSCYVDCEIWNKGRWIGRTVGSGGMTDSYTTQYLFVIVFLLVAVAFPLLPLVLARLIAPRRPTPTKNDTYECGLTYKGDAWVQFRVGYYVYALIYVIFAVETVFLYPWAVAFGGLSFGAFIAMMVFVLLLLEGLIYAWAKGALDWK